MYICWWMISKNRILVLTIFCSHSNRVVFLKNWKCRWTFRIRLNYYHRWVFQTLRFFGTPYCTCMSKNGSVLLFNSPLRFYYNPMGATQLSSNPPIYVIKLCLYCRSVLLIECHLRSQLKGPLTLMRSCAEQIVVKKFDDLRR